MSEDPIQTVREELREVDQDLIETALEAICQVQTSSVDYSKNTDLQLLNAKIHLQQLLEEEFEGA